MPREDWLRILDKAIEEGRLVRATDQAEKESPKPEQFGITEQDVKDVKARIESVEDSGAGCWLILGFAIIAGIIIALATQDLAWGFGTAGLMLYPGALVTVKVADWLLKKWSLRGISAKAGPVGAYLAAKERYDDWARRMSLDYWRGLRGRDFESAVARLFGQAGYSVSRTPATGDKGIDLVLISSRGEHIIVQCKGYKSKIGPSVVREMIGTLASNREANAALIVCNTGYTSAAREATGGHAVHLLGLLEIVALQLSVDPTPPSWSQVLHA